MQFAIPATSANLGPGFDSLGLGLDLKNIIDISPANITSIHIKGEGEHIAKLKTNNLFVKIFYEILKLFAFEKREFKFLFTNNIPVSRGLGSSSAVIIGAIYAAFCVMDRQIDNDLILRLALKYENHPDNITPALLGGFVSAMVKKVDSTLDLPESSPFLAPFDMQVCFAHTSIPQDLKAVIVIPNTSISTKQSRLALQSHYKLSDVVYNLSRSSLISAAFFSHQWELLRVASMDRIHQYARMKALPMLFQVQKIALANGAISSTLSGSGSSFLNICYKDDAKNLQEILQNNFTKCRVLCLEFDNVGAQRIL